MAAYVKQIAHDPNHDPSGRWLFLIYCKARCETRLLHYKKATHMLIAAFTGAAAGGGCVPQMSKRSRTLTQYQRDGSRDPFS